MTKEDFIRKITSRKLWMALALFISGLLAFFEKDAEKIEKISGLIMQGAAVLGYILGEGLVDANTKTVGTVTLSPNYLDNLCGEDEGDGDVE